MSRSVADATRFTATSPHAYMKPSIPRSKQASSSFTPSRTIPKPLKVHPLGPKPDIPAETPAQKVARLRAQHVAKRASELTTWDKVVVRGRTMADVAHRITVMSLIGLTVVAGGVTAFSLGDMIMYNRRKRKVFLEEQHVLLQERLVEARTAAARGAADEDQILLLNRERAAEEADEAKKSRKTLWKSIKGVFSTEGLQEEDTHGKLNTETEDSRGLPETGSFEIPEQKQVPEEYPKNGTILHAMEERRREGERELERRGAEGGVLDKLAEQAASTEPGKRDWTSWLSWR